MKKLETFEDGWIKTTPRYVAYLDIMGFKDMVLRSTHEEIYNMMLKINESNNQIETIKWVGGVSGLIKTTTFSDSILVYSKDDSPQAADSFICTISALTNDLLIQNIPHKGAVSFGTMTLDTKNSIFFGQPLIDSYLLQEEVFFYGVVLHATAEKELIKHPKIPFLKNYLCPFKNGSSWNLTIEPMFSSFINHKDEYFKSENAKVFDSIRKFRLQTSGHIRKYIDNTEYYLKDCLPKK